MCHGHGLALPVLDFEGRACVPGVVNRLYVSDGERAHLLPSIQINVVNVYTQKTLPLRMGRAF